ncbi:PTS sugar transporter subunit IIB [Actinomyces qiguomingii]|uniref:PTS sugar transporter subunit IIB n=1 Tax=Actinomyces qiguomingii TaxID=2057800 RepID=UPI0018EE0312|nr:PTS sugar transporter subunit IIB [Actinomyces qiguomingii]
MTEHSSQPEKATSQEGPTLRIMLACALGMSTSILVQRMQEAAAAQGKNYKIWAADQSSIESELGNFDVVLLGPQVRHILRKVRGVVGDAAPVEVIDARAYGRGDGATVIAQAESLTGGE